MKQLRVKTFIFSLNSDDGWSRIEKAIKDLHVFTINTMYIPTEVQEVSVPMPVEAGGSITNVRITGNSYMMIIVWYWEKVKEGDHEVD